MRVWRHVEGDWASRLGAGDAAAGAAIGGMGALEGGTRCARGTLVTTGAVDIVAQLSVQRL